MTKKILLDTNFLVAPFQFGFDIYDELEKMFPYADLYTLEDALQEAKSIKSGKYKELVPKMLEKQDVELLTAEGDGEVDDLIVNISDDFIVATNDKELKRRLKKKGRPVIIIRSMTHLEVVNSEEY
ncbi:hypothetical protein [Candidatus Nanohalococcus occultus]|uniref:hypothetical protein n=1 Tax=Candidatus Nanohalococcus occultus TaxID=2978047 RepID=UPI0039E1EBA0